MSAPVESPKRLVQQAADARNVDVDVDVATDSNDSDERRAAKLLRVLQTPPPRLSSSARARIVARLDAGAARVVAAPRRALWPAAFAAAVVLFVLFLGGAVGAAWGLAPARRFLGRILGPATVTAAPATAPRRQAALVPGIAPDDIAPEREARIEPPVIELTSTVMEPRSRPLRRARVERSAERGGPAETPPSDAPVVVESRLLAEALTDLRQRRDPQAALRALDEYERRFPSGALAPEASAARIDTLLALGRRSQALQRLETLSLERLPRGTELRVLRGELRAGRGELGGAVDDFGAVLAMTNAPAGVVERALYGRGSCRARLGDVAGARADLQDTLRRFPNGPFAEPARRALRD